MQNAETVLSILREPRSSHRRAGRSETIISGSGGGRREQDHASDTSPDGLPRAMDSRTATSRSCWASGASWWIT
jgi:hypothetical protein